jgi:hypothetical protein
LSASPILSPRRPHHVPPLAQRRIQTRRLSAKTEVLVPWMFVDRAISDVPRLRRQRLNRRGPSQRERGLRERSVNQVWRGWLERRFLACCPTGLHNAIACATGRLSFRCRFGSRRCRSGVVRKWGQHPVSSWLPGIFCGNRSGRKRRKRRGRDCRCPRKARGVGDVVCPRPDGNVLRMAFPAVGLGRLFARGHRSWVPRLENECDRNAWGR